MYVCIYACIYVHVHMYMYSVHTYMYVHVYIHIVNMYLPQLSSCDVCIYTLNYKCIHVHTCL